MKLAIMQPYFFPYIGYFQLINAADRFILLDDVQYIRHGWINRNRILKPEGPGFSYISLQLASHTSRAMIKDIEVVSENGWKEKIVRQLDHYKKKAPYYKEVLDLLKTCFSCTETNIARFNGWCLQSVCSYIGIHFKTEISSQMNLDYSHVHAPGQWALRICEQLGGTEYLNPCGGMEIFNRKLYQSSNVSLQFMAPQIGEYNQSRGFFEPNLSIIDVLMFNSADETKSLLSKFTYA
ncbi:WbqC family protein [Flavisolibacter nicotianae]|uniref:WbqC family protein n=1 Tax=Flavisolibacter nicotianae TaxID=2364882 RepID=UPI000EB2FCE2|nr:WbqC family protein [Flavisolibacter nicotianae]